MALSKATMERYGDPFEWTNPVSPKTGQREQQRSLWSFGGYYSNQIHQALRNDDADGFVDLMRAAQLDRDSKTLDSLTMEQYCEKLGAVKCKASLEKLTPISAD